MMTIENVLITGNSSGLGLAFTKQFLEKGATVFGFSRRGCSLKHDNLIDKRCNQADFQQLVNTLKSLLINVKQLDLIILNAGILGEIRDLQNTPLKDIQLVMDTNVWANKVVLDHLLNNSSIQTKQIVFISSGAAVNGNKGWGAYSLSKATLNMLAMLYAHEMPDTHISALAPGLVDTAMQDHLCDPSASDSNLYPSLNKLRAARGTDAMPSPEQAASNIVKLLDVLLAKPSGSFHDIRTLNN